MTLSFPPSPSVDDEYVSGGRRWRWSGVAWDFVPVGAPLGIPGMLPPDLIANMPDISDVSPGQGFFAEDEDGGTLYIAGTTEWKFLMSANQRGGLYLDQARPLYIGITASISGGQFERIEELNNSFVMPDAPVESRGPQLRATVNTGSTLTVRYTTDNWSTSKIAQVLSEVKHDGTVATYETLDCPIPNPGDAVIDPGADVQVAVFASRATGTASTCQIAAAYGFGSVPFLVSERH